jgi:hypothetical protein
MKNAHYKEQMMRDKKIRLAKMMGITILYLNLKSQLHQIW